MYFRHFVISPLYKRAGPFIFKILNILHPRMICALHLNKLESPSPKYALCQVWLKLTQWFWRRRFFFRFRGPSFDKLEFPSSKDALLCTKFRWIWPSAWFWRKICLVKFVNVFLLFSNYLPLEKGIALHLNKLESSSPTAKDALGQVWLKLSRWFWGRRRKCEKFTTTTTMDNGQIVNRKAHLSLRLRWAKKLTKKKKKGQA